MYRWRIKSQANEEARQQFLDGYVPQIWELGLTVPDPKLRKRDDGRWEYSEPDWDELRHVVTGHGPKTEERLARELGRPLKLFVASQPTRGVDVGSIEFIHRRIVAERDKGTAVLIVSTELDEIYALADRIVTMYEGRITGEFGPGAPPEQIGVGMLGGEKEPVAS